jgi:hypothetical protein
MATALVTDARLMEAFASAHEQRSRGYQDLVSNSNVFFYTLKERGGWKTFSGPDIRETLLYNESGSYIRYSGFDFLNPAPTELFNDAVFEPKMAAVSITLSGEKMLKNSGPNQIFDLFEAHLEAAEQEMIDRFTEDLHSAGTATNQIGGLQLMVPTTVSSGSYGGIARSNSSWQTTTYDANSITVAGTAITTVSSSTIRPLYNHAVINRSRNKKGPNLILAAQQHFQAYSAATDVIQRINDENALGKLGFQALKYFGAGKSIDIVMEGGIGSAMPDDVSYLLDMSAIKFRYHPDRNFSKIGGKQTPINQDAVVQHVGFMGELTMNNPLHQVKLYDSSV